MLSAAPVVTSGATMLRMNVAVTERVADIAMVHGPVPVQSPDQPLNALPDAGAAASVIVAPGLKSAEHPEGPTPPLVIVQALPAGEDATLPEPLPAPATKSETGTTTNKVTLIWTGPLSAVAAVSETTAV